jgi:hypothetical protein
MGLSHIQWEPVMAKHVEREQTNQVIELTADEIEHVSGGFTVELTDVKVTSNQLSGHDSSTWPAK